MGATMNGYTRRSRSISRRPAATPQARAAADAPVALTGAPRGPRVSPSLRLITDYVWRVAVLVFAIYFTFVGLARLQAVVVALFIGLVICAILSPLTGLLARYMRRGAAAGLSLLAALAAVGGLLTFVVTSAVSQSASLSEEFQQGIDQIANWLDDGPLNVSSADLNAAIEQARGWISTHRGALVNEALSGAGLALELVSGLALALFCAVFFLSSGTQMWTWVVGQVPARHQRRLDGAVNAGWTAFAGYTRGILVIAFTNAVLVGIVLFILRVPLALPLAVLVFFASFIPLIGAPIALAIATLVALAGRGPVIALVVLAMIVLIGQFEGHVLHPLVMSRAANLHPLVVVVSVASGAVLGGVIGAVVAVPLVSTSWGVINYLRAQPPQLGARGPRTRKLAGSDSQERLTPPATGTTNLSRLPARPFSRRGQMTEAQDPAVTSPKGETPSRSADEHLRDKADVEPGKTLGIDNTDTALSPEDTGYTPDAEPEPAPAGKGSDPPLEELP